MAEQEAGGAHSQDGNLAKIGEFIRDIDFAMMTTVDEGGELQSRPMSTQKAEFNGNVYFFAFDDSNKVRHIARHPKINLAYSQPDKQNYVSLKGEAEILKDKGEMEELWSPELKAWFPQELETPGITLIKVSVKSAEYWDAPSSFIAHSIGLINSTITGESQPMGENVTVELNE